MGNIKVVLMSKSFADRGVMEEIVGQFYENYEVRENERGYSSHASITWYTNLDDLRLFNYQIENKGYKAKFYSGNVEEGGSRYKLMVADIVKEGEKVC